MADSLGIVILAAGKGTRLKVDIPKALCPIQGKRLIDCCLENLAKFQESRSLEASVALVVGHGREEVMDWVKRRWPKTKFAWQKEQKGTAHALQTYFEQLPEAWEKKYTLVACADTPLIGEEEFSQLWETLKENEELDAVAAVFEAANPFGYGRIIRGETGFEIVEEKEATEEQRQVKVVNSGLYLFKTEHIKRHLDSIKDSEKTGEFYLTDLFKKKYRVEAASFSDPQKFLGINNLLQLEEASRILQKRKIEQLQLEGVRFLNSSSCYIEETVEIAPGSVVYPNVVMEGNTKVGANCAIEAGATLKNCQVESDVQILANSYIEEAIVRQGVRLGPMARIRPGSNIGANAKIGNFVEIKNSDLGERVSVSHLSYVGDAEIGENTNLGCGFITCNYDGANKHKTLIGKNCFIGSDSQMIAPITLGDGVYVASGSTINKDIPAGAFAIARERQTTKEGMAKRFIKEKSKKK